MYLFYYLFKSLLASLIYKKKNKAIARSYKCYCEYRKNDAKSPFQVMREVNSLCKYWHCFPDSYFRFGMFLNEWNDIERIKSFIPQGAYAKLVSEGDTKYNVLIDDKIIFHDLMNQYGLPVPVRLFTFRNNEFRQGKQILCNADVDKILSSISDPRIFVKRFTGGAASGVFLFTRHPDGTFKDEKGEKVSANMIRLKYKNQSFIFEQQIKQDYNLAQFNPDTVNTIRVLTFNNEIVSASVRFGGKGEYVDNVSAHGVACSINVETGALSEYGLRMYDVTKYYEHPDSHVKFAGHIVSQWPQVRSVVEKSIKYLPYFKSVGYDIATTNNGPVIIEINTGAGINLSQMGKDYGLAKCFLKKSNNK